MDFAPYTKKLRLPEGFTPPSRLVHDDIVATPLTCVDLAEDLHAIRTSVELIRRTRGGKWPPDELSEAEDVDDLVWHEVEWAARLSYAYVVRDIGGPSRRASAAPSGTPRSAPAPHRRRGLPRTQP